MGIEDIISESYFGNLGLSALIIGILALIYGLIKSYKESIYVSIFLIVIGALVYYFNRD